MKQITEKAYAKINLTLDVTGKRPDGYHDMLMVMQTVTLCDDVTVELIDGKSYAECNLSFVPCDERNLAVLAANKFFAAAGMESIGAKITLDKRIPVGAGMAGGSSNAAAVLRALNTLTGEKFSREELEVLAAEVGSDVAFCVSGGTQLASGRGEILKPLTPMPDCSIVICKPEFSISTPELFRRLDSVKLRCHPDTQGVCEALDEGDLLKLSRRMYNVFEDVPDRRFSTISQIKCTMLDCGAMGSIMTGTGSAVFGIYDDECAAQKAVDALKKEFRLSYLAKNMPRV